MTYARQKNLHPIGHERGAALMVALVLLLVITILAVSTMGTSRMQLMMAGNTQFSLHAFQAAQSAIEVRIAENEFTTGTPAAPQPHNYTQTGATASSSITYQLATEVPAGGYSIGSGFLAYHFEIDATATAPRGARSEQTQGLYIVGPGGS